jgi:hypothetical protein
MFSLKEKNETYMKAYQLCNPKKCLHCWKRELNKSFLCAYAITIDDGIQFYKYLKKMDSIYGDKELPIEKQTKGYLKCKETLSKYENKYYDSLEIIKKTRNKKIGEITFQTTKYMFGGSLGCPCGNKACKDDEINYIITMTKLGKCEKKGCTDCIQHYNTYVEFVKKMNSIVNLPKDNMGMLCPYCD